MKKFTKTLIYSLSLAMLIGGFTASAKASISASKKHSSGEKLNFGTLVGDYKLDTSVNFNSSVLTVEPSKLQDKEVTIIIELDGTTQMDEYIENGSKGELLEFTQSNQGVDTNNDLVRAQANITKKLIDNNLITNVNTNYTVLFNGISVQAKYKNLSEIKSLKGVKTAYVASLYAVPEYEVNEIKDEPPGENEEGREYPTDSGLCQNDTEYQGEGMFVAVLDTGIDYNHEAFAVNPTNPKVSKDDIAAIIDKTNAKDIMGGSLTADDVYKSAKIPFQFDYTDKDADALPLEQDHGTHVSGITLGNSSSGNFKGVAPEAQLAFMKVFSDYQSSARDDVILSALEDCALLDVDVINESLGSYCGYATESELDEEKGELNKRLNKIYTVLYEQGITVNCSAGNDYFQCAGAPDGSNLVANPDSGNTGAPATFTTAMSVASLESKKAPYVEANGDFKMSITNAFDSNSREYDFIKMVLEEKGITDDTPTEVEYVVVPNLGAEGDYNGLDVKGKIAFVKRGTLSFADKIANAASAGAVGIVIYNNTSGIIRMSCGDNVVIPACSITNAAGMRLLEHPNGKLRMSNAFLAEPIMSDFSSLGPAPDLNLKPEITSCGGDVYSAIIGGKYARYSGTSMSCPNLSGISAALREYVTKNWTTITGKTVEEMTKKEVMFLVNQIEMSTTEICIDEYGVPYTPRKQGAGIASLKNAIEATSYLSVDGTDKVKAELKDDKKKTGTYTIDFNVTNFSSEAKTYNVKNLTQTESTDADGKTTSLMGHTLNPDMTVKVNGTSITGTEITVGAKSTAKLSVTLQLSSEEKAYIDSKFPNGMYVEGYIQLVASDESHLNIPFLAFYGDWSSAPIWDKTYYEIQSEDMYKEGIEEKDRLHADLQEATPFGHYGEFYIIQLGSYIYEMSDWEHPILSSQEKAAISIYEDQAIYDFYALQGGLLRSCEEITMTITCADSDEVIYTKTTYNNKKDAYYSNSGQTLGWFNDYSLNPYSLGLSNSSKYIITFDAKISDEYPDNPRSSLEFSFYVDYEAPTVSNVTYTKETDKKGVVHYYANVTFYDNRYCMSYTPCVINGNDADGYSLAMMDKNIPIYQENAGEETVVTIDITDYLSTISQSATPDTFYIYVDDYAVNSSLYYISLDGVDFQDLSFADGIEISENQVIDLVDYCNRDTAMLQGFKWKCNPSSVAKVQDGQLVGLKRGVVTVTGTTDYGVTTKFTVKVLGSQDANYQEYTLPDVSALELEYYDTKFAYTDDVDRSEIGSTGDRRFAGIKELEMYPRESVQYTVSMYPWYHETKNEYSLEWSSSDYTVVDVDENGVITAQSAGTAIVTAYLVKNGKTTRTRTSVNITVNDGMITSGAMLTGYKGLYEDIFVTKESGITYISNHAFTLYNYTIVNDEFDYLAVGNDFIKTIYMHPEIEMLSKGAMQNLTALQSVVLPRDITVIDQDMFSGDVSLKEVEIVEGSHITTINHNAFYNCKSLLTIDLSNVTNIGDYAFAGCSSLNNIDLSKQQFGGTASFMGCTNLTNVTLSANAVIGKQMFENSGITFTELPSEVIGARAFYNCKNLTSIHFTGKNITIGANAFANCSNLESITFDEGATVTIAKGAFAGTKISNLTLNNVNVKLDNTVFSRTEFKSLTLNGTSTFTMTNESAFSNAAGFEEVNGTSSVYKIEDGIVYSLDGSELILVPVKADVTKISSTITTIGKGALAGNVSTSITLPSTLTNISDYAFASSKIATIDFSNAKITLSNNALRNASSLTSISNFEIESIGSNAFNGTKIKELSFSNDVTIASYAFANMTSLEKVTFAKDATIKDYAFNKAFAKAGGQVVFGENSNVTIGKYAFADSNIKTIDLSKATEVGDYAFNNAILLEVADLSNLSSIGAHAFDGASTLKEVTLSDTITSLSEGVFANTVALNTLDIKNVTTIGNTAFKASAIKNINFTKVEEIGDEAFAQSKLTEATLNPNGVTLGEYVFQDAKQLKKVVLSSSITTITKGLFFGAETLSNINLDNIEVIEDYGLANCSGLISANLNNVKTVGLNGLVAISIQEVNLPNATKLGNFALFNSKMTKVSLPKVEYLGDYALANSNIETLDLPTSLEHIGVGVTYYCSKLSEVTVESKPSYRSTTWLIEDGVFYTILKDGSYMLDAYPALKESESFTILDGTTRIQDTAFMNASKIKEVIIPASVTSIGDSAFYNTELLTHYVFLGDAPRLEGFYSNELVNYLNNLTEDQRTDTMKQMYKYAYWAVTYFYSNFNDFIGVNDDVELSITYNYENRGFDSFVYNSYFKNRDVIGAPEVPVDPGETSSSENTSANPSSSSSSGETPTTKKGCKGEISSLVLVFASLSLAGTALFLKRKEN